MVAPLVRILCCTSTLHGVYPPHLYQESRIRVLGRELVQWFLLHSRRPVELTSSQPVQFHLGKRGLRHQNMDWPEGIQPIKMTLCLMMS